MDRALIMLALLALSFPALSATDTPDGHDAPWLAERATSDFDTLLVDPDVRLDGFSAFFVEKPTVNFRDHWQRDQNRFDRFKVKDRDVARIQEDLSAMLQEIITESFLEAGFELADAPANGVLVIRPAVVELDIIAPDVPTTSRTYAYSQSAGAMTLEVEVSDGHSERVMLRASERKRDPDRQTFEWRTRPYNTVIARRMMRTWAEDLQAVVSEEHWLAATR
jgi:hypothetical protein